MISRAQNIIPSMGVMDVVMVRGQAKSHYFKSQDLPVRDTKPYLYQLLISWDYPLLISHADAPMLCRYSSQ